jgi:hypothetical protein
VNPSLWIVKATWPDEASSYFCGFYEGRPWQDVRAHALRYESPEEAQAKADELKEGNPRIVKAEAVELVNPRSRY